MKTFLIGVTFAVIWVSVGMVAGYGLAMIGM